MPGPVTRQNYLKRIMNGTADGTMDRTVCGKETVIRSF